LVIKNISVYFIHNACKYTKHKCTRADKILGSESHLAERSILLLIIPVGSPRLDFASWLKPPPKHQLHPLQQMTCNLDMAHVSEMILGVNIIVCQKTLSGEVVDEATVLEVLVDLLGFFLVVCATDVLLSLLGEGSPLGLGTLVELRNGCDRGEIPILDIP